MSTCGSWNVTLAPRASKPRDDPRRRGVPGVADVRLEGDADDAHPRALERLATVVERLGHEVDDVTRHRKIDVPGELDELIDEVELPCPPRQVVRIDRDAVAADAGSRREPHEPEWLRGGRVDDLPHVEAHPLAQQGKLVHERDVHVAEHVLEQLGQLRGVGRRQLDDPRVDPAEERGGSSGRVGGRRTDEPRDVLRCAGRVTRTDAFRCEREIEIDAGAETAALEGLAERAGRRPGERRRLEDDELARTQPAAEVVRCAEDRAEVRILGRRDRGGNAHEHRVDRRDIGVLGGHDPEPALQAAPESLVVDVVDR